MKVMVDTGLLLAYYTRNAESIDAWGRLRCAQSIGDIELWAAATSLTGVFDTLAGRVDPPSLANALWQSLDFLEICSVGREDLAKAFLAYRDPGSPSETVSPQDSLDYGLVNVAARRAKVDVLLTDSPSRYHLHATKVMTPQRFFDYLREVHHVEYEDVTVNGKVWHLGVTTEHIHR